MARSVFLLFSISVIALFALLFGAVVENKNLTAKIQSNSFLIDSLQDECTVKDLTLGRYEFIIDQYKEKHPYEAKKIFDETE